MASAPPTTQMRQSSAPSPPDGSSSVAPELYEEAMWQMNMRGSETMESGPYPDRPGEPECAYYIRTGLCRFGMTCKFNHPTRNLVVAAARIKGGFPERVGEPECQGQLSSVSSPERHQQITGTTQFYGTSRQSEMPGSQGGAFSSYRSSSIPMGLYALQRDNVFPERPDQPECQFYMKTGDCKFGAVCKFDHPRERLIPMPNCVLSPLGLPLRPVLQLRWNVPTSIGDVRAFEASTVR